MHNHSGLRLEPLEARDLAYALAGSFWPSVDVTYSTEGPWLADRANVIDQAFAEWDQHSGLEFVRVDFDGDITIYETSQTLIASALTPGAGGEIRINPDGVESVEWADGLFFQYVMRHEIGHAIGLGHSETHSVMSGGFEITDDDVAAVQTLYGADLPDACFADGTIRIAGLGVAR